MPNYQVVAEMAAHVEVQELGGASLQTFYKGAVLPDGVPAARIKDLLDKGVIAVEGEVPLAPNAAVEQDPARGLESVTTEVLQGEKPQEPRVDPAIDAGERVKATMASEGAIDKAAAPTAEEKALAERRADARAKLDEVGGAPDGRSSDAVMVEYLVKNGYDRTEVEKADRNQLKQLVGSVGK